MLTEWIVSLWIHVTKELPCEVGASLSPLYQSPCESNTPLWGQSSSLQGTGEMKAGAVLGPFRPRWSLQCGGSCCPLPTHLSLPHLTKCPTSLSTYHTLSFNFQHLSYTHFLLVPPPYHAGPRLKKSSLFKSISISLKRNVLHWSLATKWRSQGYLFNLWGTMQQVAHG